MEDDKQLTNNEATETTHHRRRMSIFGIWSGIWKREGEIWIIGSGSTSSPYHTEMLWIRRKFDHSPQQNEFSSRWTQIKLVISTDVSELWRRKHDTFDRTVEVFGRSLENGAIRSFAMETRCHASVPKNKTLVLNINLSNFLIHSSPNQPKFYSYIWGFILWITFLKSLRIRPRIDSNWINSDIPCLNFRSRKHSAESRLRSWPAIGIWIPDYRSR